VANSARFAGQYGDGLITVGGESHEMYKEILENFAVGATEAGKDPDQKPRMIEIAVDFTENEQQAIEARKTYWAGTFVPALFTNESTRQLYRNKTANVVGAHTIRETVCISSDPEAHVKKGAPLSRLRSSHFPFCRSGPAAVPGSVRPANTATITEAPLGAH